MATPGPFHRSYLGVITAGALSGSGGSTTHAMAGLNAGWCARVTAPDTRDVKSVWLNFSSVSSPGTMRLRIETIDAATGKPSGTLYDPAATVDFTPAAGWNNMTFATLPTTGLVAGNEYAIVLLTTVAGTTMTLRSYTSNGSYPTIVLHAADGTTRTNFAEVASGQPTLTVVFEDDSEESLECSPYATVVTNNISGTVAVGAKFTIPSELVVSIAGVEAAFMTRLGTPAGDLRFRIFDASDVLVAGTSVTMDKDSLVNTSSRNLRRYFSTPVDLSAGTYRAVFDSPDSSGGTNCWRLSNPIARSAAVVASGYVHTRTDNVGAAPVVWTDTPGTVVPFALVIDDLAGSGGGGGSSGPKLPVGRVRGSA